LSRRRVRQEDESADPEAQHIAIGCGEPADGYGQGDNGSLHLQTLKTTCFLRVFRPMIMIY
uniref:Uncharacterized protein n=1 Tax=Heligmosomoides polygyrus TaxID=6339 RepID=A0A8L8KXE5_HELPZ